MRNSLVIIFLSVVLSASAQTAADLRQHRVEYKAALAKNIHADTSKVDFYPFSKKFIVTATVTVLENEPVFKLITSSGTSKEAQKYVKVDFSFRSKHYVLYGYQLVKLKESPELADHFFIPFRDRTSNKTTYGAGRYLDFKTGDIQNGKLVIDFNKAYNPYCAFTDGYNCPIPPKENTLELAVTAGEKKYLGEHITK